MNYIDNLTENQRSHYANKEISVVPVRDRLPGREEARHRKSEKAVTLSTPHIWPVYIEIAKNSSYLKTSRGISSGLVGGGKRGKISGFSSESRRRLMLLIAKIQIGENIKLPCFVTLTFPDKFPSPGEAKRDLQILRKRLDRKFPGIGYIWKLEPQERGAPHFHLLVWGVQEEKLFPFVLQQWYEIAGQGDINHLLFHGGHLPGSKPCVSQVRSWKGVWSYASKYIGKTFEVAGWDNIWTGRFWGVHNKENIPFGEVQRFEVPISWIYKIQRLQRRKIGGKRKRWMKNNLICFCDVNQWMKNLPGIVDT